ncbi:LysR family transcriptional regulator [Actinosynnema sp. ALI-1.44]|uniref:LysR family transcriptional regulator n=1 Tax=Actinosynnema sp. ALI-1.44 TaxID=1933779 RepID=UPI00143D902C|nr:LysR family transcriptional regulator [Actinosynnema sp. ALI-1.44]
MRTIIAVAECGSIGRAAIRLGQSQPAVSGNVKRIEKYFGGALFHRSASGVRTTPLGDWVLVKARTLAADMDQLVSSARSVACGSDRLTVAGQPCATMVALIPQLPRTAEVRVDHSPAWLLQQLAGEAVDVCVLTEPAGSELPVPAGVHRKVIARESCPVGMSAEHPLADKDTVDLADLADDDWVDNPFSDSGLRTACGRAGFEPRVRYWIADPGVYWPLVRSGRAVGLFTGVTRARQGVVFRSPQGDPLASRVVLCWRDRTADQAALIHRLTSVTMTSGTESPY